MVIHTQYTVLFSNRGACIIITRPTHKYPQKEVSYEYTVLVESY